ncbi:hypothetical protein QR680_015597 [Steinernema hermaphroditum]|uniref:CCHC-type domain-containing protein n=1 Tax=Steinernema hermaphroditum TaxID=289476 RepID=A0AA39LKJ3_9BILA|nr:hypothetical protein QR680_015597 [Steinernema hermaphroditum]
MVKSGPSSAVIPSETSRSVARPSDSGLKKLAVPCFDGNIMEWPNFNRLFEELVCKNTSLSEVEKLNYLVQSLKGDAKEWIGRYLATPDSFTEAYKALVRRYGDVHFLSIELHKKLRTLRAPTTDIRDQRRYIDQAATICTQMKTLQTKTDNLETVYTVLGKLPNETCDKTMDKISIEQFTDIDLVLEKVDETLTKLSFAQHTKSATSDVNKTNSWNKTNAESPRFKDARQLGTCVYCKRQGHNMSQCVTVSDKQERARILRDENRCMNCAAEGHSSVNCRSLGCRSCGGKHHTSTCVNLQTYREHETSLRDTATRGWSVNHTQPMMERQKNTPTQTKLFASQVQMEPDTKKTTLNVGRLLTATVPVLKEKTKQDENVIAGRENFESDSITAACVSTTDTQDDMIEVDKLSVMEAGTDKFMGPLTVENDLINQQVVKRFSETTKKPDDDYVVRFPWKEHGSKSQLPSNYKIALRRLESETHRKRRQTTMGSLKQATPKNTTKVTTSAVEGEALLETTARKPRKRLLPNKDDGRAKDMKRSRVESTIGKP